MSKKKIIIITIITTSLLAIIGTLWYYLTREDNKTTLTLIEKQWIEKNKNQIYDFGIPTNIPMFSNNGSGIIFDFLKDLENNTGLVINKVSYDNENELEYSMKIKNVLEQNDILVYKDTYALITKKNIKYNSLEEIKNLNIKILKDEDETLAFYLSDNENLKITVFENIDDLLNNLVAENDAIIIPKTQYLKQILANSELNIAYNLNDLPIYYTISLGNNEKLNTIITKFYNKWKEEEFEKSYDDNFIKEYFSNSNVSALEEQQFSSKTYKYGYIINTPFDTIINNEIEGFNHNIIESFANISGVTIESIEYGSYEELIKAFDENKIDFFMNGSSIKESNEELYNTISIYDEKIAIISHNDNDLIIDSVNSLKDKKVYAIKDSKIASYLEERGVDVIESSNTSSMLNKINKNSVIALEKIAYDYYRQKTLKDYKIDYEFPLKKEYGFTFKKNSENKVFMEFYNFYLTYINEKVTINNVLYKLTNIKENSNLLGELIGVSAISGLLIIALIALKSIKKKVKGKFKKNLTKEEKLKYIDMLTSLKNRNYLNDNITIWDDSEVYPQSVIVVDLNNIAYINDNYGHAEGDEVIKEAANILIKNQLANSEIIRTNGNEFLIYLVGYDEKQIVSYLKKLNKELKDLSHGFGSASGYSMINDGIKTIDDAINEATIEMRTNKEENAK